MVTLSITDYNKILSDSVSAGALLRVVEHVVKENKDRDRDEQIDAIPISDICVVFGWKL